MLLGLSDRECVQSLRIPPPTISRSSLLDTRPNTYVRRVTQATRNLHQIELCCSLVVLGTGTGTCKKVLVAKMTFWHRNKSTLNKLVHPALRALSVPGPAASSAVERIFSQGACCYFITSPRTHVWQLSLLSRLIFLKCNKSLLRNIHWDSECLDYWFLRTSFSVWHYLQFMSFLAFSVY